MAAILGLDAKTYFAGTIASQFSLTKLVQLKKRLLT